MRLIQQINKQYIFFSFIVLILAGASIFFILKLVLDEETDERLAHTFKQIVRQENQYLDEVEVYPIMSVRRNYSNANQRYFSDTLLHVRKKSEKYRQLVDYAERNGIKYKITLREEALESDDLYETLTLIILLSFTSLLVALFIINKRIAQKIWSPFFENLEKLKKFSLQSLNPFTPTETQTDELNEMNVVLKSLTNKVMADYDNLKKFSENASHELQTPLAIIRTKIESILEENALSSTQAEKIQAIYHNINRLSKINKGLILLTKIENKQFTGQEEVSFNDIINAQIENFSELIEMKELEFHYQYRSDWKINGDKILVEMLINNLFGNAILHNSEKGRLIIELDSHLLKFSNSGEEVVAEKERLFERFYKSGATGSTGLGLAITKQICLSLSLKIGYTFENQLHIFKISF
jgi:signal transduction histidine kinase